VATPSTIGRKMTATGVLFRNADEIATVTISTRTSCMRFPPASLNMAARSQSRTPERINPAESTNIAAMVISASFAKPASASSG